MDLSGTQFFFIDSVSSASSIIFYIMSSVLQALPLVFPKFTLRSSKGLTGEYGAVCIPEECWDVHTALNNLNMF